MNRLFVPPAPAPLRSGFVTFIRLRFHLLYTSKERERWRSQPLMCGWVFSQVDWCEGGGREDETRREGLSVGLVANGKVGMKDRCAHARLLPAQQARTWKVLRISLRDFWSIFPLILIKTNQLTPLLKKSYHSKFFMFFQVIKFTFWYGISMNLKVMLLNMKQIESCKKLLKLNFWPYLDDF